MVFENWLGQPETTLPFGPFGRLPCGPELGIALASVLAFVPPAGLYHLEGAAGSEIGD